MKSSGLPKDEHRRGKRRLNPITIPQQQDTNAARAPRPGMSEGACLRCFAADERAVHGPWFFVLPTVSPTLGSRKAWPVDVHPCMRRSWAGRQPPSEASSAPQVTTHPPPRCDYHSQVCHRALPERRPTRKPADACECGGDGAAIEGPR